MQRQIHTIAPVYDENSRILILGSFPSVKSRESEFFYGHAQNRFWRVIAAVTKSELPKSNEEKKMLLLKNKIALWDVAASCEIAGSSDASMRAVIPNDILPIIEASEIKAVFTNGTKATELYKRYIEKTINIEAVALPSTSPANARMCLDGLIEKWKIINIFLKNNEDETA